MKSDIFRVKIHQFIMLLFSILNGQAEFLSDEERESVYFCLKLSSDALSDLFDQMNNDLKFHK